MQIFWVSGPVGQIRRINLTFKALLISCFTLMLLLIFLGSALQLLGFRFALEYDPQIARRMGNLHTAIEIENLRAVYQARLQEIELEQARTAAYVKQLEAVNIRLNASLVPLSLAKSKSRPVIEGRVLEKESVQTQSKYGTLDNLLKSLNFTKTYNSRLAKEVAGWSRQLSWLDTVPITLPVAAHRVVLSSVFGNRIDPITRRQSIHEGIDFELPHGTPVLAAADGVVMRSGWDADYGYNVLVQHVDGYATRYAHASELQVVNGEVIKASQVIGKSGNSGRSTGPHLHFEVLKESKAVDPAMYLTRISSR